MKSSHPFVSLIVVNYNGSQYLENCLNSLRGLDYPRDKTEIIVVDNCSDDGSADFIAENFKGVKVIHNDVNNYARANNAGIRAAKGDFISFINNDIEVHASWLGHLVAVMREDARIGMAGGKILLHDGMINSTGLEEYPDFYYGDRGYRQEDTGQYDRMEEVSGLCGAAVLYRKECLDDIGFFDEDYIMYFDDVDMCLRCSRGKWKMIYVPQSVSRHHFRGSGTLESVRNYSERNRLLFIAKHFPGQVASSLCGKGYFQDAQNNIFDVLPLVVSKFFELRKPVEIKAHLIDICASLKKMTALEKSLYLDKVERLKNNHVQEQEAFLRAQEALRVEYDRTVAALKEQVQNAVAETARQAALLNTKESLLADQVRVCNDLEGRVRKAEEEIAVTAALVKEKEASLEELMRLKSSLETRIDSQCKDIEARDSMLVQMQAALDRKEDDFNKLRSELASVRRDNERMASFDRNSRILLVKPQKISLSDTEETVRLIKMKYPNSSVYLFANLLKDDYERLAHNNAVEKALMYCNDGRRLMSGMPVLYFRLLMMRFDMAVVLLSHAYARDYKGYKKAKIVGVLSNAKHYCFYYVD